MEIDLRRVALIVCGLLEVDTIRQDVALTLLDEDLRPECSPLPCARQVGKEDSCVEETKCLAREVSVG